MRNQFGILGLLTFIISGCFAVNQSESSKVSQTPPNTSSGIVIVSPVCDKYHDDQLTVNDWDIEYIPSLTIDSIDANTTDVDVILQLFCQWLQHSQTTHTDEKHKLNDYVIHRIEFSGVTKLAKEQEVESTALIIYSVKPDQLLYSHWVAGNGVIENEWISNKSTIVGLYTSDGFYKLKLLGGP